MKINFDKIICINLKSLNAQQLFAICETYLIGFGGVCENKKAGFTMIWVTEDCQIIAHVYKEEFHIAEKFSPLTKKEYDRIKKIKPIKTPKMPKGDGAVNNYKAFLAEGYEIATKSMDSKIANRSDKANSEIVENEVFKMREIFEIDAILDKISKYGISSITEKERLFLDNR